MFGFERAVEALYHKMLDVEHQLRVAFTIGIGVELLRYDEVVVPFEGVAVDAGVVRIRCDRVFSTALAVA